MITFNYIDITVGGLSGCSSYVTVYDGPSASSSQLQEKKCGIHNALDLSSTGRSIVIIFHSDGGPRKKGFHATCSATGSCPDMFYGANCNLTCGKCKTGTICNKSNGKCPQGCKNWWQGQQCKECLDGRHGTDCTQTCGNCKSGIPCDKSNGKCTNGCAYGWQEPLCKECTDGRYGQICTETCGNCKSGAICDKSTGGCHDGCEDGWQYFLCKECIDGRFGHNCTETCGSCESGAVCDKSNGRCHGGCENGWQESLCKECINGRFGHNCTETCGNCKSGTACDKSNGGCHDGCENGWQGSLCTECVDGRFGYNCKETCGKCKSGAACNKSDGRCPDGCKNGWQGSLCKECKNGFYGINCRKKCGHCQQGTFCRKSDGHCPEGCDPKWQGDMCDLASSQSTEKDTTIAIIAACLTVTVIVVIVIIIVIFVLKRRKRRDADSMHMETNLLYSSAAIKPVQDKSNQIYENMDPNITASEIDMEVSNVRAMSENDKLNAGRAESVSSEDETQKAETAESGNETEDDESISCVTKAGDINVYHNHIPPTIPVTDLKTYIDKRLDGVGFANEFKVLPTDMCKPHNVGKEKRNKVRNRFARVYAYDHSRVKLEGKTENESDYINASYIKGYNSPKAYIATQGPAPATISDFWAMVWQENTRKIIMLTNLFESAKKKCEKYWPDHGQTKTYGQFSVTCQHYTEKANYSIREMTLQDTVSGKDRNVTHFHLTTWPDHGVPSAPALVSFWKEVKKVDGQRNGPPVIHCSAGIGRTGAFIALDNLMDQAHAEEKVNIFLCIATLREDRVNMVQTVAQYAFVHHVVLEAIKSRSTMLTTAEFQALMDSRLHSHVDHEYKSLQELGSNGESISQEGRTSVSTVAPKTLPAGVFECSFLPSFKQRKGFILTQSPTESTVDEYWQLFQAHGALTVVSIKEKNLIPEKSDSYLPKQADEEIRAGSFHIKWESRSQLSDDISETTLTVSDNETEPAKVMSISMFTLNALGTEEDVPCNKYSLLLLLDALEKKQQETRYHPIIVHCYDDASQAGSFCAVSNVIARLKQDKEIDVFLTVRELQCINPNFVKSLRQYRFCYDVAKEYITSVNTYANL